MIHEALRQMPDAGLNAEIFSSIQGNPSGQKNVMDGVLVYTRWANHDGVNSLGGGSALTRAKGHCTDGRTGIGRLGLRGMWVITICA